VKTYRWLTLVAALLVTLSEVLIFNSEAARDPQRQASVAAAPDIGSDTDRHRSLAAIVSLYWAAAEAQSPERVR
jgi:hypothetical protein